MIENFDTKMWLGMPLNFHNICTIYPLTIRDYLVLSDIPDDDHERLSYNALFTQFMINHDFLKDAGVDYTGSMWDFFFLAADQLMRLMMSLAILTKDEGLHLDAENRRIYFSTGKYLSAETFPEFSDIVLQAHCFGKYHHVEKQVKTADQFKSAEYYEKWKKLQANRAKFQKKEGLNITQCVKLIQLTSASFIPDNEIMGWTYWKLLHWYNAIILQNNYTELQQCFSHWGGKDLRKTLDKLKEEIMTKV